MNSGSSIMKALVPAVRMASVLLLLAGTAAACRLPGAAAQTQEEARPQGQTPSSDPKPLVDPGLLSRAFADIASGYGASYGVYFSLLDTGEEAGFNPDRKFCSASCHKLFLVQYIYELAAAGSTSLDNRVTYTTAAYEQGAGEIQFAPVGTVYTVRQLCRLAIAKSDNIAANLLKRTYGYDKFRRFAASIGCPVTGTCDGRNMVTARELGIILRRVVEQAAADPLYREVVQFLKESIYRSRIPAGVPEGVEVGNKVGDYRGCANDAAIVFVEDAPYVLAVMSSGGAAAAFARFSRCAYNYLALVNQARRAWRALEGWVALVRSLLGLGPPARIDPLAAGRI